MRILAFYRLKHSAKTDQASRQTNEKPAFKRRFAFWALRADSNFAALESAFGEITSSMVWNPAGLDFPVNGGEQVKSREHVDAVMKEELPDIVVSFGPAVDTVALSLAELDPEGKIPHVLAPDLYDENIAAQLATARTELDGHIASMQGE